MSSVSVSVGTFWEEIGSSLSGRKKVYLLEIAKAQV
jgi:hypothetical protein